ncbi:IS630 transposase-related protein [Aquicoccus sp. G2-2]|uniref:IS630 transposase-related protein n=1 Tax=Aquicoccus sp. G2-2 TaxID=3092120 RepID=UPI002ADFA7A0|nr:IS630 transposase-related protein [Aquicoccus sp. G2-2]MEA1114579.1 IS630 transposase-related protein [Aquicoccus sp. G2-2]
MNKDQREIQRRLRILRYAEEIGHVAKTYRKFGIGRADFYRWRKAYTARGEINERHEPVGVSSHVGRKHLNNSIESDDAVLKQRSQESKLSAPSGKDSLRTAKSGLRMRSTLWPSSSRSRLKNA